MSSGIEYYKSGGGIPPELIAGLTAASPAITASNPPLTVDFPGVVRGDPGSVKLSAAMAQRARYNAGLNNSPMGTEYLSWLVGKSLSPSGVSFHPDGISYLGASSNVKFGSFDNGDDYATGLCVSSAYSALSISEDTFNLGRPLLSGYKHVDFSSTGKGGGIAFPFNFTRIYGDGDACLMLLASSANHYTGIYQGACFRTRTESDMSSIPFRESAGIFVLEGDGVDPADNGDVSELIRYGITREACYLPLFTNYYSPGHWRPEGNPPPGWSLIYDGTNYRLKLRHYGQDYQSDPINFTLIP